MYLAYYIRFVSYEKLSLKFQAFTTSLSKTEISKNKQEAHIHPTWRVAIQEEMGALERNDMWEIVKLPCKWVVIMKYNAYGSINSYKLRLVVKGFC